MPTPAISLALDRYDRHFPFFDGTLIVPSDLSLRIFQAGEMGRHLYFISQGKVEVIAPDGKTIYTTLEAGDFFGEIALISNQPRTASVRTIDYCDLYTIDRDTFQRILTHYPDFERHIQEVAQMRQERSTDQKDLDPTFG